MRKSAVDEIKRFQTDRDLHLKNFDDLNEQASIVEELLEAIGLDVTKENREKLKEKWSEFAVGIEYHNIADRKRAFIHMLDDEKVDAYCDIVVFAVGAIMKLGYDPEKALLEVSKEINSRTGSMVNGKFEKNLTPEAKALWYKADYNNCKINKG